MLVLLFSYHKFSAFSRLFITVVFTAYHSFNVFSLIYKPNKLERAKHMFTSEARTINGSELIYKLVVL